ncbi:subunit 17 of mediator complex-domain-containing protein [Glomus cerebriforme]|uniref:Mediator of RNA polymerase II transcription subunit 17 n=1 Tax=Glomus cerebriforme TaxID=658196 RepID=A0A397TUL2_9GLOM|nr:subunit 17 of mediator complex-domain-containing protein [Glomus cerebriforme]
MDKNISIEPRIEPPAFDVTIEGKEIYQPKQTPTERFSKQVRQLWAERDFRTLTIESLENGESSGKKESKADDKTTNIASMKNTIRDSVASSHNDIGIGIDVLNLILSDSRPNFTPTNPLPVPSRMIQNYGHSLPQLSKLSQFQNFKLMLGMKRRQLKHAAGIISSAAEKLSSIVEKEKTFWNEAVSLREHHWTLQRGGSKEKNADIHDFDLAGSIYLENTAAQILRSLDEKQIAIALPQKAKGTVKLRLRKSSIAPGCDGPCVQENSLNIILSKNYLVLRFESIEGSNIHQQLLAAQKAVFEAELFEQLVKEARVMTNVILLENEICLQVYPGVDLTIQWANNDTIQEDKEETRSEIEMPIWNMHTDDDWTPGLQTDNFNRTISPESSTCTVLKLAMDLLVRRFHRRNFIRDQERVIQGNRGVHRDSGHAQILTQPLHLLKYHFFCIHLREVLNSTTKPLKDGGIPVQIHFISHLSKGKELIEEVWKKIGNDKLSLFTGSVIVIIDYRHSIRFTLESPGTLTLHLPHIDMKTRNLTQFQELLHREIKLLLLRIVLEKLNTLTGLKDIVTNAGKWYLDSPALMIYKDMPPAVPLSAFKKKKSSFDLDDLLKVEISEDLKKKDEWIPEYWRRPVKITIVDGYSSQDKLAVRVEAALADAKPELIIGASGKNIPREFGEMVYEFLVNLL